MAAEGFISPEEAADAATRPLVVRGQPTPERSIAPYFAEEIRKTLEQKYGADALYHAGLAVQTTLDVDLQDAANHAVDRGLRRIDKRRSGYRKPERNIVADGLAIESFKTVRWSQPMAAGDIVPAVVIAAPRTWRRACAHPDRRPRLGASASGLRLDQAHGGSRRFLHGRRFD